MNSLSEVPAKRSWFPWAVVLCVVLAMGVGVWYITRSEHAPKFRFHMPDGCVFRETVDLSRYSSLVGGVTTGPRRLAYHLHLRLEYRVRKTRDGYVITSRPLSVKSTQNGKAEPIYAAMSSASLTYRLDKDGKLLNLAVDPGFGDQLRSAVAKTGRIHYSPEMERSLRQSVIQQGTETWNRRVTWLIGRRARTGETWRNSENVRLFSVEGVEMQVLSQVVGNEVWHGRPCVRIAYAWEPDMEQLRRAAVSSHYYGVGSGSKVERLEIISEGQIVVEPDGLRPHSANSRGEYHFRCKTRYGRDGFDSEWQSRCTFSYPQTGPAHRRKSPGGK